MIIKGIAYDAVGRRLKIGQKCIYNRSGSLAVGTIEKIVTGPVKKYTNFEYYRKACVSIRQAHVNNEESAHVSEVKNTEGIIVVKDWPWKD